MPGRAHCVTAGADCAVLCVKAMQSAEAEAPARKKRRVSGRRTASPWHTAVESTAGAPEGTGSLCGVCVSAFFTAVLQVAPSSFHHSHTGAPVRGSPLLCADHSCQPSRLHRWNCRCCLWRFQSYDGIITAQSGMLICDCFVNPCSKVIAFPKSSVHTQ